MMEYLTALSFFGGILYVLDKAYHAAMEYWCGNGKPPMAGKILSKKVA